MDKNKVKVLYVLSGGHSGSTVLSLLLGVAPEVFNAGELKFYSKHSDSNFPRWETVKNQCSCGEEACSCPFWMEVEKASPDLEIKYRPGLEGYLETILTRIIPRREKIDNNDAILFRQILQSSKALKPETRIILDISKNLPRYLQLQANPHLEVSPIFLVRDGRGYMNSYRKRYHGRSFFWLLQWVGVNLLAWLHLKIEKKPYYMLSYDHFCRDPEKFLHEINEIFNINVPSNYIEAVNQITYHVRAGNVGVLGNKIFNGLEQDISWKTELPKVIKWTISLVVIPFNRLFGV